MNEQQRPFGGHDEPAPDQQPTKPVTPEQQTAPVSLESTRAIGDYPPPTGSPFLHPGPPPGEGLFVQAAPGPPRSLARSGRPGLGAGAIWAIVVGALAIVMVAALFGLSLIHI